MKISTVRAILIVYALSALNTALLASKVDEHRRVRQAPWGYVVLGVVWPVVAGVELCVVMFTTGDSR